MTGTTTPTVLHPLRLNSQGPLGTIHRRIACDNQQQINSLGFEEQNSELLCEDLLKTVPISKIWSQIRKGLSIIRLYLSKYDIIHTGASGLKTHPLLILFASMKGVKHIHTHHSITPKNYQQQQWLSEHSDVVTAVSSFVTDWVRNSFDVNNVHIIPNGVDTQQFYPEAASTNDDQILYVGRLISRKHPELVIELAKRFRGREFIIRGDGPMKSYLKTNAPDNITFIKRLSQSELAKWYAQAGVTLCPYENEGFGMVVVESMASGTPVLGLKSGNLTELIDNSSGDLCENIYINEWEKKLESMLCSLDKFEPRSRAKEYQWESVVYSYSKLYNYVL